MEITEPKHSHWLDSHISPENTKWVAENLEGFDQVINKISKLIECNESSYAQPGDIYEHKGPELLTHLEESSRLHQLLAEKYNHLIGEAHRNFPSLPQTQQHFDISDAGSPNASPFLTPNQKMSVHKSEESAGFDLFMTPGGGNSDISVREGYDSSLSSSSDSDSESLNSINKHLVSPLKHDDMLKVKENGGYEVLLRRVNDYEEQLFVLSQKLKSSEEEIASLKDELKKNESVTLIVANLQAQLESAQSDFEFHNTNLEMEREKVLNLHNQVVELETQIWESDSKNRRLNDELEDSRDKLIQSEDEIARLKHELSSETSEGTHQLQLQLEGAKRDVSSLEKQLDSERNKVLEMQEEISRNKADLSVRDHQIKELNVALSGANEKFSVEKAQLQLDISNLFEQQALLKARVDLLEYEIEQQKAENLMMKSLHEADIEELKAELEKKGVAIEDLNNDLDLLKLKSDTLMAEKDELNALVDTLRAEASHSKDTVREMEIKLSNLSTEHMRLSAESDRAEKLTKVRVEELEKEVERQRNVISDRAEEKREAIRQLCFSLEHYRSGYKELREAYVGHKRQAVLA